ncbi:ergosterol biosynthesis protein [Malassezia nana]|uniref:Ergosterol biosynthesis protein n=1 Tax=Malassezia nana TaxID=180528 RepID=A0AAF0J1V6_9BASI|nr:ergosterol biosynthesis protein [Malassezia nana]
MNLLEWIPESALGQWLWAVGAVATLNGLQNLVHPAFSRRVYASKEGEKEATALAARLFGVWNLTSAMERGAYLLCLGTFLIAQVHFFSEMLFFAPWSYPRPRSLP